MRTLLLSTFILITYSNAICSQHIENNRFNTSNTSIYFSENKGQIHDGFYNPRPDVHFIGSTPNQQLLVTKNGMSHQLKEIVFNQISKDSIESINFSRVDLKWLNANPTSNVIFYTPLSESNYYNLPNVNNGITQVKEYASARLIDIYPGINVVYYSKNNQLEYDYEIKAGSEYRAIQLKIEGTKAYLNDMGQLVLTTSLGTVVESAPIAFQNGKEIPCKWKQLSQDSWGFEVSRYNPTLDLIIDPIIKVFGSYYGGSDVDWGVGGSVDSNDNVYLSGYTNSTANIATTGAFQTSIAGNSDAYIVKFNKNGVRQWSTYFGSIDGEWGYGCATDLNGNVYLAGETQSNSSIATSGSHQTIYGGSRDGFLLKLNNSGIRQWSTYIGGSGFDYTKDCSVDLNGDVFVCGYTTSTNNISTAGTQQVTYSALYDAYLLKFNGSGVRQWGTYCGGTGNDYGRSCSTDSNGNVFISGSTESTTNIATAGSHQATKSTGTDGFLVKYSTAGIRSFGTYYGGTGTEGVEGMDVDLAGNIYLTGFTTSSGGIATAGSHKPTYGGNDDAFVVKFSNTGTRSWGSYFGGANYDRAYGCAVDASGKVFITGVTLSTADIASTGSHQTTNNGSGDAFIVSFSTLGVRLYGTYIGGPSEDYGISAVVDSEDKFYAIGYTSSASSISTSGAHQTAFGGGLRDALFVQYYDCPILTQPTNLTGESEVCQGINELYAVNAVAGATHYEWSYTGMGVLPSDSLSVDFVPISSGVLSVVAINLCSTSPAQTFAITVIETPAQPDTIFGLLEYCLGNTETYSIDPIAGALSYSWMFDGVTLTETSLNVDITPSSSGMITVVANNNCFSSSAQTLPVTILEIPSQPNSIQGSPNVCNGATQIFSVIQSNDVDSYIWEFSPIGVLLEVSDSLSLSPVTDGILSVIATNSCGNSVAQNIAVTIVDIPNQPSSISGSSDVCIGTSEVYSIVPVPNADNYIWEYTTTGILTETSETLTFSPTFNGTLSVTATNSCGNSLAETISIIVNNVPAQPDTIYGLLEYCLGNTETYSIDPISGALSYSWVFDGNALTETSEVLTFTPSQSGLLTVTVNNLCGPSISQVLSITLSEIPAQPNAIVGTANLCDTLLEIYSIDPVPNAHSYSWSYSGNGDATSNTISTGFAPTSNGTLSVVAINSCGTSIATDLMIAVTVIDTAVVNDGNYLTAVQTGATYNWFACPSSPIITGETNQNFLYYPFYMGYYAVEITLNGCVDTSSCTMVTVESIEENNPFNNVVLFPNPTNESFSISNLSYGTQVEIVDVMGKLVYSTLASNTNVNFSTIDWANGTYFIKLSKDHSVRTLPLVVIH